MNHPLICLVRVLQLLRLQAMMETMPVATLPPVLRACKLVIKTNQNIYI